MKEVRSKDLTEQEVPMLSKNVHSLWVIDCEFPRLFWRNILQQLIGCPTLQLLWLQETNVNEVEEDLDRLLEIIMAHYKEQVTVTQHQRDIQSTHYQRELTLFIQKKCLNTSRRNGGITVQTQILNVTSSEEPC